MDFNFEKLFKAIAESDLQSRLPAKMKEFKEQEYSAFGGEGKVKVTTISFNQVKEIKIDDTWYAEHTKDEVIETLTKVINKLLKKANDDIDNLQKEANTEISSKVMNQIFSEALNDTGDDDDNNGDDKSDN